jgi:hypothetical protein
MHNEMHPEIANAHPFASFPPGWDSRSQCDICGIRRKPYELVRHYKLMHLEAWQANLPIGDKKHAKPAVGLPHCSTCNIFLGYGFCRELHNASDLHVYRESRRAAPVAAAHNTKKALRQGTAETTVPVTKPGILDAVNEEFEHGDNYDELGSGDLESTGSENGESRVDWLNRDHELPWDQDAIIGEVYLCALEINRPERVVLNDAATLKVRGRNPDLYKRVRVVSIFYHEQHQV